MSHYFTPEQLVAFNKYNDLIEQANELYRVFRPALVAEYTNTSEVKDMDAAMTELYDNRMYLHMMFVPGAHD